MTNAWLEGDGVTEDGGLDVLFAGGIFCDLVFGGVPGLPEPGGEVFADSFDVSPGGTATRCVAAARLGLRTGLVGAVGDDLFGRHVESQLSAEPGLDLRMLRRLPGARTPVSVAVTGARERSFITYEQAATGVPRQWPWPGPLPRARAVQISVQRPLPEWVPRMREAGSLVCGGVGWDTTGAWSSEVLERLAGVDLFVPNATEAMRYTRTGTPRAAAEALAARVPHVVVTDGADGAIGVEAATGAVVRVPAPAVTAADPTGAGDVFTAAYLCGALSGWPLERRLRLACLAAAYSVRGLGGARSAPTWSDLRGFLDDRPDAAGADRELTGAVLARTTPLEQA